MAPTDAVTITLCREVLSSILTAKAFPQQNAQHRRGHVYVSDPTDAEAVVSLTPAEKALCYSTWKSDLNTHLIQPVVVHESKS